jgi:putative addiction module component (TIGR02574 family)
MSDIEFRACVAMNAEQVLEAALDLEPGERERLIDRLMESLVGEKRFASEEEEEEIERAWLAEIQRRSAELDAGKAEIVDWTDVRSRIAARRARP